MATAMPAPVESGTTTTAGLAPYAMPFVADLFGRTAAVSATPYTPYTGDRIAQSSDLQNAAYDAVARLGSSSDVATAAAQATRAGVNALGTTYRPTTINNQAVTAATLGAAPTVQGAQFSGPGAVSAQQINAPALQNFSARAAQSSYNPAAGLQQYQMGPAQQVSTERFIDPTNAQDYMSPYMQQVVNIQQREAQRKADIEATQRASQAVKAGAAGGTREAIMAAEAARNLSTQLGDIQATGLQSAYTNAQQQFNADQARALQAAQANQGAGLTVGGQNLAANLQTQGLGAQLGSQMALANLSNQQATNLANLQAQLGVQQLGAQTGLQAQQLNQAAGLQAGLANQQMQYNTALQNAQLAQQAGLANQQMQGQYGLANAQYGQQAALANQSANLQAQNLTEQSKQFGANLGLAGTNAAISAANTLGNLGNLGYQQNLGAINAQATLGGQQQQQAQNVLNQQFQDWQTQQQYPMQMLEFQKNIYGGFPMGSSSQQYQYQSPNTASQVAGAIGTGAMLYNMFSKAEGGQIKAPRSAGLADLMISKLG